MSTRRVVAVVGLSALTALACGSGPRDYVRSSKVGEAPQLSADALHDRFVVAPDRALQGVRIDVRADAFRQAADALRAERDTLDTRLSDAPGCSLRVLDYRRPSGGRHWSGHLELVVDADFAGLGSTAARMDRLDACAAAVADQLTDEAERSGATVSVRTRDPVLVVDEPRRYLPELLARRGADLSAVAEATDAPQLQPDDLRCVPTGEVEIEQRLISGVALSAVVTCRVDAAADDA